MSDRTQNKKSCAVASLGTRRKASHAILPLLRRGNTITYAPIAQPVEQLPFKEKVLGSIPSGRTQAEKITSL